MNPGPFVVIINPRDVCAKSAFSAAATFSVTGPPPHKRVNDSSKRSTADTDFGRAASLPEIAVGSSKKPLSRTTERPWLRRRCRALLPLPPFLDPAQVPAGRVAGGGSSLMRGARRRAWSSQGLFSMQGSAEERGIQRREQSRTRHVHVDGPSHLGPVRNEACYSAFCSRLASNRTHESAQNHARVGTSPTPTPGAAYFLASPWYSTSLDYIPLSSSNASLCVFRIYWLGNMGFTQKPCT
ncbi:hypothetical protein Purlil1_11650 [Purpureocillium lilacinum]|uniref:Uncharacterized protein n=1 Tax=Purpureocillium lilacinum TaxID=33203 RepID=A0ABR0BJN5_PURLI|nr:hypothetical protein Purlil1_11650 [Purpureocillium lilacinum]